MTTGNPVMSVGRQSDESLSMPLKGTGVFDGFETMMYICIDDCIIRHVPLGKNLLPLPNGMAQYMSRAQRQEWVP